MTGRRIVNRNIVLFPPSEVMQRAIEISALIAERFDVAMQLNARDRRPHVTIHQFAIPEDNLGRLHEVVLGVASEASAISLRQGGYSIFGNAGIFWNSSQVEGQQLYSLHQRLVYGIDDLREEYIMDQHLPMLGSRSDITEAQRHSLANYGQPLAREAFHPHITVAACRTKSNASSVVQLLPDEVKDWRATAMHITEVGPSGTCPGILKTYSFSS